MSKQRRKGKGKSGRRIEHWHTRYAAGEEADTDGHRGRKLSHRGVKLAPGRLEAPDENLEDLPKSEGLVVAMYQRGAVVRIAGAPWFCAIAKTFRAPEGSSALAVGDVVTVALIQEHHLDGQLDIDKDRTQGFILSRRPRETALSRPRPMSGKRIDPHQTHVFEQVIAANMDVLLIVASVRQPSLRPRLIERFLIVAERGEMAAVLAINKVDLARPPDRVLDDLNDLGGEVLCCSAVTGEGLDALRKRLARKRSVLAGASGVGKSTLINALVPDAEAVTREVRMKDQRGRHTTAATAVYDLPALSTAEGPALSDAEAPALSDAEAPALRTVEGPVLSDAEELPGGPLVGVGAGGILVDTPGVRELGVAIGLEELPWYFPEFEPFVPDCHFYNCTHTHEPDCAVLAAVEAGTIPRRRYVSYLRMRESREP